MISDLEGIASSRLHPDVIRSLLSTGIQVYVSAPGGRFKQEMESAVVSRLNALEKGSFSRQVEIGNERYGTYAAMKARKGAGLLADSNVRFQGLDRSLGATVADLRGLRANERKSLTIPVMVIGAWVGSLLNHGSLTAEDIRQAESSLLKQWPDSGITFQSEQGRIVAVIQVDRFRDFLLNHVSDEMFMAAA